MAVHGPTAEVDAWRMLSALRGRQGHAGPRTLITAWGPDDWQDAVHIDIPTGARAATIELARQHAAYLQALPTLPDGHLLLKGLTPALATDAAQLLAASPHTRGTVMPSRITAQGLQVGPHGRVVNRIRITPAGQGHGLYLLAATGGLVDALTVGRVASLEMGCPIAANPTNAYNPATELYEPMVALRVPPAARSVAQAWIAQGRYAQLAIRESRGVIKAA